MSRRTVLVVDDEEPVIDFLSYMLRDEGFRVLKARNGVEGLQAARRRRPDLVITDLMMPDLDGLELARQLKESDATAGIPIIAMSCLPQEPAGSRADAFLAKPFDVEALLRIIDRLRTLSPPPAPGRPSPAA